MVVTFAVWAVVAVWLMLLTAGLLRWRQERGDPVYRRLPNGGIRFEWSVHTAYRAARREVAALSGPGLVGAPSPTGLGPSTPPPGHDPTTPIGLVVGLPQWGADDRP